MAKMKTHSGARNGSVSPEPESSCVSRQESATCSNISRRVVPVACRLTKQSQRPMSSPSSACLAFR